tara:strand:+ start:2385 stop:3359 length:975 start_codon:yes stop_codon:yes gene_type:complete
VTGHFERLKMDTSGVNSKHTKNAPPSGIWGAVLLPINSSGCIDWGALVEEIEILCGSNLSGVYSNGTAGEFYNQTDAEFEKISGILSDAAKKFNMPFQIGVSNSNPRVARFRLKQAVDLSPNGIQFTLPDWWPPSSYEIKTFVTGMQEVCESMPLVLYNPPHSKVKILLRDIAELRELAPSLVGAKLAGGDNKWYQELQKWLPDFSVFVPGHKVAFGRPLGAEGSYSNMACLSPNGAVRHWHLINSNLEAAVELEYRTNRFFEQYIFPLSNKEMLSNQALDKLLAAIGGWGPVGPKLLWPYASADASDVVRISKVARSELPEYF